jgi:hypothetical protein
MRRNFLAGARRSLNAGDGADLGYDALTFYADGTSSFATTITMTDGNEIVWRMGDGEQSTGNAIDYAYGSTGDYPIRWDANPALVKDIHAPVTGLTEFISNILWVNLETLDIGVNSLTLINTYDSWTSLKEIHVDANAGLIELDTYAAWADLEKIHLEATGVTSLETHAEWTALISLSCSGTSLTSLETHAEWTALKYIYASSISGLTAFTAHPEWVNIIAVNVGWCDLPAGEIDAILISLDTTGAIDGDLSYAGNPGASDGLRSGAATTAKANLAAKGWSILIA